ncbi:MAG: fumarylacetoacetate hydrolase family protein [Lentisphaeraceae bacterium]|nr:fumarylacetoacetate hydrolase family protein [Lentisphaeraceae bacterium]
MNEISFDDKRITPSKVVCIGRNYVAHIEELANERPIEPVIFIKPNSAVSEKLIAGDAELLHYEGEISFIIENGVFVGVGFGLDLTKRQTQSVLKSKGLPWERAKAFDASAVFSHFVKFSGDVEKLHVELAINGKLIQQGGVEQMIFKPLFILTEIQRSFSLEDGDIVMTGTPKGVGSFTSGDEFVGRILHGVDVLIEKKWLVE